MPSDISESKGCKSGLGAFQCISKLIDIPVTVPLNCQYNVVHELIVTSIFTVQGEAHVL